MIASTYELFDLAPTERTGGMARQTSGVQLFVVSTTSCDIGAIKLNAVTVLRSPTASTPSLTSPLAPRTSQLPRGVHPPPRVPGGPGAARDLLGTFTGREQQPRRIQKSLDLRPRLRVVLVGDSGDKGPEINPAVARTNPGRILAIYIRKVRRDPGDGQVQEVSDT